MMTKVTALIGLLGLATFITPGGASDDFLSDNEAASRNEAAHRARAAFGPVIIDGPWDRLPAHADPELTVDELGALTLGTDPARVGFLLLPDPGEDALVNGVTDMICVDGVLRPAYGDQFNNQGPVDLPDYSPGSGLLVPELADLPDEMISSWRLGTDGPIYVTGQDAMESHDFGNFYAKGPRGWQKRRTIYHTPHAFEVLEFKGRLFARYAQPLGDDFPVSYPFVLASSDGGASWDYERIAEGEVDYQIVAALETVGKGSSARLYAIVLLRPAGGSVVSARLFRHRGWTWEEVEVTDWNGWFSPWELMEYDGGLLVNGNVFDAETGAFLESAYYHLTAEGQTEVPYLRGRRAFLYASTEHEGRLYTAEWPPVDQPDAPIMLHRLDDLTIGTALGGMTVLPGTQVWSLEFCRDRLYVGGAIRGLDLSGPNPVVLANRVAPIEAMTLTWDADVPDGAALSFQVRTADNFQDLRVAPWVGPDGAESSAFTVPGEALHAMHAQHTLIEMKIFKTEGAGGALPFVRWIRVEDNHGTVTVAVDEGSGVFAATNLDTSGRLDSRVFALWKPIVGGVLFYDGEAPPDSSVAFQIRTASTALALAESPFAGPDGDPGSVYTYDGQPLWDGHDGHRYLQYRVVLSSTVATQAPFLGKVVIMTRDDALHAFDVEILPPASAPWQPGLAHGVKLVALDGDGRRVVVSGEVELFAEDAESGAALPIHPDRVDVVRGIANVRVHVERSVPTRICARLAEVATCSQPIVVNPSTATALSVASNLPAPNTLWSPVGSVGQEFDLTVRATDRFGNTDAGYTGSVSCRPWRAFPAEGPPIVQSSFRPTDEGVRVFGVSVNGSGELNVVCSDDSDSRIAGSETIRFVP